MRRPVRPSAPAPPPALLTAVLLGVAFVTGVEAQVRGGAAVPAGGPAWEGWARGLLVFGGLASLDRDVRAGSHDLRSAAGDGVASFGRWYGDWHRTAPLLVAGAFAGGLAGGSDGMRRGVAALAGVVAGSMANEALNVAVGRGRPAEGAGPWRFEPFDGHASFPSGHTAYAFAIAGAIDEVTEGALPAVLAYTAAGLTGASRVYDDRHWLSDVAIGALVGAWTARRSAAAALALLGVDRHPAVDTTLLGRLEPVATAGFLGVRVQH